MRATGRGGVQRAPGVPRAWRQERIALFRLYRGRLAPAIVWTFSISVCAQGDPAAGGVLGYRWPGRAEPTLYRYEMAADSLGGAITIYEGTGPDALSITLPPLVVSALAHRMERHAPAASRSAGGFAEVAREGSQLMVAFERRLSLALLSLVLALATVAVLVLIVRRERGRRAVLLEARRREVESREAERVQLAREIHDGPVQLLTLARLSLAAPGEDRRVCLSSEIGEAVTELRAIAEGLRPPALGPFGLKAALEDLAARVGDRNPSLKIDFELEDDGGRIGDEARLALYRVAQEALSNAAAHSGATAVSLRLSVNARGVAMDVCDNGRGGLSDRRYASFGRFGLLGMRERAELVRGALEIRSPRGRGTCIRLRAPWSGLGADLRAAPTQ